MLKAIFFDMDGTITRPHINWQDLRQRVGVPTGTPIMEYVESLPKPEQNRTAAIVREIEFDAAEQAVLNPGAAELIAQLNTHPLKLALITNNHRQAMHHVVQQFDLHFDLLLSREDALLKPAPDLLLLALKEFQLTPEETCFVGDGRYDRIACEAANVTYIHLAHNRDEPVEGPTIYELDELWPHLTL